LSRSSNKNILPSTGRCVIRQWLWNCQAIFAKNLAKNFSGHALYGYIRFLSKVKIVNQLNFLS
jgi:hypothetical protein